MDVARFHKHLARGKTYHLEVNGIVREEFRCPRSCTVSVPVGNTDFDIFDGPATYEIEPILELAQWRGKLDPGLATSMGGEGWAALIESGPGYYTVHHQGAGPLRVEVEPG